MQYEEHASKIAPALLRCAEQGRGLSPEVGEVRGVRSHRRSKDEECVSVKLAHPLQGDRATCSAARGAEQALHDLVGRLVERAPGRQAG